MNNSPVLLIGGSGRSGTTILSRIFSAHPKVSNVPESRFLIDPDGIIDFFLSTSMWSPYHIDLQLKRLQRHLKKISGGCAASKFFSLLQSTGILKRISYNLQPQYGSICVLQYCPGFNGHCEKLLQELTAFRYSGHWVGMKSFQKRELLYNYFAKEELLVPILSKFLHNVMTDVLTTQKKEFYLEKNTWNILWFDQLLKLMPEARLVHIYRDPRDVISSYGKQSWMPSDPVKCAVIYKDIMNKWQEISKRVPPESFFEVSLESLVASPRQTLDSICTFWGIPWSESLLEVDLSKSHADRWKEDLSPEQLNQINPIIKNQLQLYQYS